MNPRQRKTIFKLRAQGSVVFIPLVRTLRARVKDRAAFVGRAQLLSVVSCLRIAAFFTWVIDDRVGLDVAFFELLHVGAQACAQRGGERRGFGGGCDRFA